MVFLIVIVAAFNIVSMLIMMINDKKAQLAIFKTMGMSKYEIRKIFIYLGAMISLIGSIVGLGLGIFVTYLLSSRFFEEVINSLMQDTYFINYFSSRYKDFLDPFYLNFYNNSNSFGLFVSCQSCFQSCSS